MIKITKAMIANPSILNGREVYFSCLPARAKELGIIAFTPYKKYKLSNVTGKYCFSANVTSDTYGADTLILLTTTCAHLQCDKKVVWILARETKESKSNG